MTSQTQKLALKKGKTADKSAIDEYLANVSVFPGGAPIESMKKELSQFKTSKGTVQFTVDHAISDTLLKDLIRISLEATRQK